MAAARKTPTARKGTSKPKPKAKTSAAARKREDAKRRREEKAETERLAGEMELAKQGLTGAAKTIENAQMYMNMYVDWAFGMSYMQLAEKHAVSKRRCEQIISELRGQGLVELRMDDPLFGLHEAQDMVLQRKMAISEYAKLARETTNENIRLGAMRDRDRAIGEYLSMLQELGVVPKHLGTLRVQEDYLALLDALLDGMDEEGIPVEVQRRLVERVEHRPARLAAGDVDGKVLDAAAA